MRLVVSPETKRILLAIMSRVNESCNWFARRAFELKCADRKRLQRLYYREARELFGLSAQHTLLAIAKVCRAYKRDRTILPSFQEYGSITFDPRIYAFKNGVTNITLRTLDGRVEASVVMGAEQKARLANSRGQADLIYRNGKLFFNVSVKVPEGKPIEPTSWLGVDLGIRVLAMDSEGTSHSGAETLALRSRITKLRSGLQRAGTRSARRHLRKLSGKERNFHTHTNHVISKELVRKAKDTGRGIAIENLTGIRDRETASKAQRSALHSWSFYQLRTFLTYKALLSGVLLVVVDPRNTSRTCPECSCVDKRNRRSQAEFLCIGCGFSGNADHVAARNIASRGPVIDPHRTDVRIGIPESNLETLSMPVQGLSFQEEGLITVDLVAQHQLC